MALAILLSFMGGTIIILFTLLILAKYDSAKKYTKKEVTDITRLLAFRAQMTKKEFEDWISYTINKPPYRR